MKSHAAFSHLPRFRFLAPQKLSCLDRNGDVVGGSNDIYVFLYKDFR
jgi:hypothetical protein